MAPSSSLPALSDEETLRYNRQIVLRGFDFDGQERLKASHALVVGLGGLGCAATQYLASAGIGKLTLLDFDTVSLSNLQRQILHTDARIGMPKVESARQTLCAINPHVEIRTVNARLEEDALDDLIAGVDLVLDCTDNVAIRDSLNRLCFQRKTPLVSGAAIRMEGQISVFTYQPDEPCYRCLSRLFGQNVLSCVEAGVMAPLVGIIGTMQALEAIKLLTHFGTPPGGRLLMLDAMTTQWRSMALPKNPHCEVCGAEAAGE
ncbi:molybdopterin-synthase adenylyltransferase MoeB [Enterobacillus tribolii]|uniref:Molybdopterin-synthase adenylyltransferase n=1 Tax=Enterobacillus tribolii TaxID=1487935 RepID=A0A370QSQ5_9GAMM|nr:molybdopterin-synthase adenylyltransferase MoeB [Enterobacillus tribolii]MBW7983578.1 molybdopterin-synthase adenylyltransferase MoeB [Enterobacillus tribolii]RDK91923.1 [molybdopterin synthase] sulfurylase [Enterobacillus tribolii]